MANQRPLVDPAMDPMRNRNAARIKFGTPPAPKTESHPEMKYSEDEKKTITKLKQLYLETIDLDVALQKEIYNLEKNFQEKHNVIFEKRKKILDEFRKQNYGDSEPNLSVPNFWLKVLKASYTEFISKKDEKILECLCDIRARLHNDPVVKFDIEFHFDPNDFFTNTVLTKTYFLNCLPDPEDPLSYDGAEIYKCVGCKIDWKQAKDRQKKDDTIEQSSFFDFFSPPVLPDDTEDPNYCDINAILQNDFELGFYLKERVIPKAVIFFTGEIADCQSSSDSETETDDTEDESDAEEEEAASNDK
ncbi:nucleosome assembly protein 1-like 1 [Drosophila elegans]|uniref:nucleosome assembly protein 1-like 1 n=1 Tax=Drosophila elegans TaxID=30023 RepID=UPI0007E5DD06|nr:nucleosome assembly protein 1-like 1 [Drosophila elegans]